MKLSRDAKCPLIMECPSNLRSISLKTTVHGLVNWITAIIHFANLCIVRQWILYDKLDITGELLDFRRASVTLDRNKKRHLSDDDFQKRG